MAPPFRCIGRLYPNGPPACAVGCDGRVAPRILQFVWEEGEGDAAPFNGVWQNTFYSLPQAIGFDPRVNWNTETSPLRGTNISVRMNPGVEASLWVDIAWRRLDASIGHTVYKLAFPGGGLDWGNTDEFEVPFFSTAGGPGPIADPFILVRRGTYARIPPNSCIGA